jgi:hypothetical protein
MNTRLEAGSAPADLPPAAALTLLIRTGRPPDYKREMLRRLCSLVQAATGAPDEEIVLSPDKGMDIDKMSRQYCFYYAR